MEKKKFFDVFPALKLNDNLVYYGAFLNVSIKNSAASREDF